MKLFAALILGLWLLSPVAYAHFALASKVKVGPETLAEGHELLAQIGDLRITRAGFMDHLSRITAFDTRYDRTQPNFAYHYTLARDIALFHPDNVQTYLDRIETMASQPALHRQAVNTWFRDQLDVYVRLLHFHQAALKVGVDRQTQVKTVLDFHAAAAATEFLEELIVMGDMEPSVAGLKKYAAALTPAQRRAGLTGAENDLEVTPPEQQRTMKKRWIDFRHDLLPREQNTQRCGNVGPLATAQDTVLLRQNGRTITYGDLHTIFGRAENERRWQGVKQLQCNRTALYFAAQDLLLELDFIPDRVTKKNQTSTTLYLAGLHISRELGPELLDGNQPNMTLSTVRTLIEYPKVLSVKDLFMRRTNRTLAGIKPLFVDRAFVDSVPWQLRRAMAPKHSIHL